MPRGKVYSLEVDSSEHFGWRWNLKYVCLVLLATTLIVTFGAFLVRCHVHTEKLESLVWKMDRRLQVLENAWEMHMKTREPGKSDKSQENSCEPPATNVCGNTVELKHSLSTSNTFKRLEYLTQEVRSLGAPGSGPAIMRPCGGFVNISEAQEQDLIYEIPFPAYIPTCAWVLWSPRQTVINIELVNNSTNVDFLAEFSLSVAENPKWDDDCCVTDLVNQEDGTLATQQNFALLFFHGVSTRPGQGFHLVLSAEPPDQENDTLETTKPSDTIQPDIISVYGNTYMNIPLPKPINGANSLRPTFIIGHAAPGTTINVTVTDLEMRWGHEWLRIFWFDSHRKIITCTENSAKGYVPRANFSVIRKENEPFILYFTANSKYGTRVARSSLNVTYNLVQ